MKYRININGQEQTVEELESFSLERIKDELPPDPPPPDEDPHEGFQRLSSLGSSFTGELVLNGNWLIDTDFTVDGKLTFEYGVVRVKDSAITLAAEHIILMDSRWEIGELDKLYDGSLTVKLTGLDDGVRGIDAFYGHGNRGITMMMGGTIKWYSTRNSVTVTCPEDEAWLKDGYGVQIMHHHPRMKQMMEAPKIHDFLMNNPVSKEEAPVMIGVDIMRYGQRGLMGRYGFHLHFSGICPALVYHCSFILGASKAFVRHYNRTSTFRGNTIIDAEGVQIYDEGHGWDRDNITSDNFCSGLKPSPKPLIEFDIKPVFIYIKHPSHHVLNNELEDMEGSGIYTEYRRLPAIIVPGRRDEVPDEGNFVPWNIKTNIIKRTRIPEGAVYQSTRGASGLYLASNDFNTTGIEGNTYEDMGFAGVFHYNPAGVLVHIKNDRFIGCRAGIWYGVDAEDCYFEFRDTAWNYHHRVASMLGINALQIIRGGESKNYRSNGKRLAAVVVPDTRVLPRPRFVTDHKLNNSTLLDYDEDTIGNYQRFCVVWENHARKRTVFPSTYSLLKASAETLEDVSPNTTSFEGTPASIRLHGLKPGELELTINGNKQNVMNIMDNVSTYTFHVKEGSEVKVKSMNGFTDPKVEEIYGKCMVEFK